MAFSVAACSQKGNSGKQTTDREEELRDTVETGVATFSNPLLDSGADPWVLKKGGQYYYTHTTGNRLVLRQTDHMENLDSAVPLTIWKPDPGQEYSHDLWAPEIHFINDKWYMYFAATTDQDRDRNRRMFVLENSSDSPMNTEWEFKGKITDTSDHWAIDGTVLETGGAHYFIWSGWRTRDQPENSGKQQLYIARMENPWTLSGERVMISEPELEWERHGLVNEGPVAWKNPAGDIFLFYSGSGCWTDDYAIGVLKLTDPDNPLDPGSWEKYPEAVFSKNPGQGVYAPGHNSFFKSPDGSEDWILYHANDNPGDGCSPARKPRMQKMEWDSNGFPRPGIPVSRDSVLSVPSN
ncbi:glycosyl hydrolase family 43 [Sinomicrobium soli]|nr:glycosyl hydrolase family 43 [Sinomicrobium sp. N-1-3-6]